MMDLRLWPLLTAFETYLKESGVEGMEHSLLSLLSEKVSRSAFEEFSFYFRLGQSVLDKKPEDFIDALGAATPTREKYTYFVTAQGIAVHQLALLLTGTLIAADPNGAEVWGNGEEHKAAAESFVKEVRGAYVDNETVFLKFPEVRAGVEHLEGLLAKP